MKRKRIIGISLVLMLSAGIAICLEACKKDIVTPINILTHDDYHGYSDEAKAVACKIRKFKRQLDDKEYFARSGLNMAIDSVIWNVEALFNAEYANPDRDYLETVKQELDIFVDVNDTDQVPFDVVADLYDEITVAVRQAYLNDGISTDKSLKAVVVDKGEIVGNRANLKVYVISGKSDYDNTAKDPVHGPFSPGDCWYFGEYGGTCDDPSVFGDAAEVIEDTINYYYGGSSVPQSGFRYLNSGMFRVALDGNEYLDASGQPYLYFYDANGDPPVYLDYEMLNYYYVRELAVLLDLLPSDPRYQDVMPMSPAFIEVDIVGVLDYVGNSSCFSHKNYVIYGDKNAIPVQELPPLRDLLNG